MSETGFVVVAVVIVVVGVIPQHTKICIWMKTTGTIVYNLNRNQDQCASSNFVEPLQKKNPSNSRWFSFYSAPHIQFPWIHAYTSPTKNTIVAYTYISHKEFRCCGLLSRDKRARVYMETYSPEKAIFRQYNSFICISACDGRHLFRHFHLLSDSKMLFTSARYAATMNMCTVPWFHKQIFHLHLNRSFTYRFGSNNQNTQCDKLWWFLDGCCGRILYYIFGQRLTIVYKWR